MNKWEKEVQASLLSSEEEALKELERQYKASMKSVMDKVKAFDADIKMLDNALLEEGLDEASKTKLLSVRQSKVYQKQYQQALQSQISGILDNLHGQNYSTIEGYLKQSYTDAFVGTMYDIAGQGIPIISPINQAQVTKAVLLDSKVVKSYYDALGVNWNRLKKVIAAEVSRGIASSQSYADIARNIDNASGSGLYNATRIARTEGHRIQQAATNDAQHSAKDKGADVVKQWDAALDGRTRTTHRQLDGQIREIDEPFEVDGRKVDRPGYFGDPAEDCNCRCACTTRARWALDEAELQTLKDRAAYYGLDKTKDFNDYKKKYLKTVDKLPENMDNNGSERERLELSDFPSAFTSTAARKKETQSFIDYINNVPNADPEVVRLYKNIGKLDNIDSKGIPFKISYTAENHAFGWKGRRGGDFTETSLKIPKINGVGSVGTTAHELGHVIDSYGRTSLEGWAANSSIKLKNAIKSVGSDMSDEVQKLFSDFGAKCLKAGDEVRDKYMPLFTDLSKQLHDNALDYKAYKKAWNALEKERTLERSEAMRGTLGGGVNNLQDIYDALSGGKFRDTGKVLYGHGGKYFYSTSSKADEIWANYCSLSVTRPELVEVLKRDKPELVEALSEIVAEMNGKV